MTLAAGDLRHAVDIQSKTETTDGYGGQVFEWATVMAGVRCKVIPVSGKEMINAGAEQSQISTRFMMRYREGVVPAMRIIDASGEAHEIISVIDVGCLGRDLEIVTKAWVNEG